MKVIHLINGRRSIGLKVDSLDEAKKTVRFYKRRGFTAWIEDDAGNFIPVPGVMRLPKSLP